MEKHLGKPQDTSQAHRTNRALPWLAGALLLMLVIPFGASAACADPNGTLNGTYGFKVDALYNPQNSPGIKAQDYLSVLQVGYFTFDGNGSFTGAHDTNLGGRSIPHSDFGTYSVNSDCETGTIHYTSGARATDNIVILGGGEEIRLVGTDSTGVAIGTARLMTATGCSTDTIAGQSYAFATRGLIGSGTADSFPRASGFAPFADAGSLSFGADGTVSGTEDLNLGGMFMPGLPVAGSYTVNENCTGTVDLTIRGVVHSWNLVILDGAEDILFIDSATGWVWAGTLGAI